MKTCTKCKETKPLSKFYAEKKAKDGKTSQCGTCLAEKARRRYTRNPKAGWVSTIKKKYGITEEDYYALLEAQENKCANGGCRATECGPRKQRWCIDHNHETGEVRGLLCSDCNAAAGILKDNPAVLIGLANYLKENGHYG